MPHASKHHGKYHGQKVENIGKRASSPQSQPRPRRGRNTRETKRNLSFCHQQPSTISLHSVYRYIYSVYRYIYYIQYGPFLQMPRTPTDGFLKVARNRMRTFFLNKNFVSTKLRISINVVKTYPSGFFQRKTVVMNSMLHRNRRLRLQFQCYCGSQNKSKKTRMINRKFDTPTIFSH